MKKLSILVFLILFSLVTLSAQEVLLGERVVNFKGEKDTIVVTYEEGVFTKLQFKVQGNAVLIHKIIVTYGNGEKDELEVKLIFKKGDWSREIDLKGNKRIIRKITFFYKTVGKVKKGKATIKVFGIK
jgi:adenine-specific DNA methylase